MAAVSPVSLDLIIYGLHHIEAIRYAHLASGTIVLYEHITTIGDEFDLIWKAHWSLGKILFLLNRYYILLSVVVNNYGLFSSALTDFFCIRFIQWQGWTGLVAIMLAEMILQMRLYALYSLNKKILILMVAGFVLSSSAAAAIMGYVLSNITVMAHPATPFLPNLQFCTPSNIWPNFYAFWLPILGFETLLCGLALTRGVQTFMKGGPLFRTGRQLLSILIRDSIIYFIVMFATYLTCLLVWIAAPISLLEIPIGFSVALSCVFSSRIVFNVRRVSRDLELSKMESGKNNNNNSVYYHSTSSSSVAEPDEEQRGPRGLTAIEMAHLRALRIKR